MSDRGDSSQGGEDQNTGQGSGQGNDGDSGQGSDEFTFTRADYEALQGKIKALETDNFRYRQRQRQQGGGNSGEGTGNGAGNTASNVGQGTVNTNGEVAALQERLRSTNFRASIADTGAKHGLQNSATLARVMKMDGYTDDEGNIENVDLFYEDAKLLYPSLFKKESAPPPIDAGAGGRKSNQQESFSDLLRREVHAKTGGL